MTDTSHEKTPRTVFATVTHEQGVLQVLCKLFERRLVQPTVRGERWTADRRTGMKAQQAELLTWVPSGQTCVGAARETAARATRTTSKDENMVNIQNLSKK